MMDTQPNQPSPPVAPAPPEAPAPFRKTRAGHFASDGHAPHRSVPGQPPVKAAAPNVPPAAPPKASTPTPTAPRRFETSARPQTAPPPKQPQQQVLRPVSVAAVRLPIDVPFERTRLFILAIVLVPLCIFGSWEAWENIVYAWQNSDDYSHGFIVIPATLLFLYLRLETYPGTRYKLDWVGLFPILIYGVLRIIAGQQFISPLDAYAIWFWILSVVWFFYGWRVFLWALPSLCFLVFMFQLPFSVDMFMRGRLQMFAAHSAAGILQTIGVAAIPITNTIRLSTMELGVEAACSGLRFLMSVFAIAFATVLLMRRPWWQNILILAVAAPLALFVNAVRIAITGVLLENHYDWAVNWLTLEGLRSTVETGGFAGSIAGVLIWITKDEQSVSVATDAFAGKITIVLALGLFALFVWYLGKVFRRVEI
ncbi:MAG: exosortase/archaeosortase family protein [Planctomycetaceae bacterium]|nr:exosortase/archaeosortase family protein [Planctomycetaceae bacterium]